MSFAHKTVILLAQDPQVLKGLQLLLEDMGFHVISMLHYPDSQKIKDTLLDQPELLVLPFEFDDGKTGNDLVRELRASFQQHIPAILLSAENGFTHPSVVEEGIWVLSDRINPKHLRDKITRIMQNSLA